MICKLWDLKWEKNPHGTQVPPFYFPSSSSRLFASVRSSSLLKTRLSTKSLKIRLSTNVLLQPDRPSNVYLFFFDAADLQPDRLPLSMFFFRSSVLPQLDRPPSISSFFFDTTDLQPDRLPLPLFFFRFVLLQVL